MLNLNDTLKGCHKNWDLFSEQVPITILYTRKKGTTSLLHTIILSFSHKINSSHKTHIIFFSHTNTFMTSRHCFTCNELGNTSYTCFACHRLMCIPCTIAHVLSTSYPAKIIRNCPFCNSRLTEHETKRLYLANLEYAGSTTDNTHQHKATKYKQSKHSPYI